MPNFGDPFAGHAKDQKLTHSEFDPGGTLFSGIGV